VKTEEDLRVYQSYLEDTEFHFDTEGYAAVQQRVGDHGVVMVPLMQSPLKLLHNIAGQETACLLLLDYPETCAALFEVHRHKTWQLAAECCRSAAEVFMTMDNLDALFHPPDFLRRYCVPFYRELGDKLRAAGKLLFSHACGRLKQIGPELRASLLDGLEGMAPPPLGDLPMPAALDIHDRFIINGGMTVHILEKGGPDAAERIDGYTRDLLGAVRPRANRFLYSSGCNTSIATPFDNLKSWRDTVWQHGNL
jgi:uroporphyrinogen-III decarboxylase